MARRRTTSGSTAAGSTASESRCGVAPAPARGEEGSAYIIALLVLFVLTAMGLSVSFVSQTELIIGSQERTIQRTFFAADAGLQIATAKALNRRETSPVSVDIQNPAGLLGADLVDRIETSVFAPIQSAICNLCQINQGSDMYVINHAITSQATRLGPSAGVEDVPLAVRTVSAMVSFDPWPDTPEVRWVAENTSSLVQIRF
ncbi:MAG TPA: pilus assembly PilX N-terminal domain-containing protein [Thermoanaerobaculia bacterium]|nr:pilus assembly PilX N-terminal domain-containing protein [Thermoanaerobaculia bacterium]